MEREIPPRSIHQSLFTVPPPARGDSVKETDADKRFRKKETKGPSVD